MSIKSISTFQNDALKEVVNIGTNHAITAIAQMIDKKVSISMPDISTIPLKEVPEKVGKEGGVEKSVVGLYVKILGDITGSVILILSEESARQLAKMLVNTVSKSEPSARSLNIYSEGSEKEEIEKSALMEVGNILTNSYLNALSDITNMTLFPSIPHYAHDMLGAVLDYLLIEISRTSDTALITETLFSAEGVSISGDFLIFPDLGSLEKILSKVG